MKHETANPAESHHSLPSRTPSRSEEHRTATARPQPAPSHPSQTGPHPAAAKPSPISPDGRATFNVRDLATLLGVGRDAIYAAANRNEIPGTIRLGGRLLFARAKILTWLGTTPEPPDANADAGATLTEPTRVIGRGNNR